MRLAEWAWKLVRGIPHQVIGGELRPYMKRWYLIPRNRWLNVYLHQFLRSDEDRALHDHPWWFVSIMIRGQYTEITESGAAGVVRAAWSIALRRATHRHRVVIGSKPAWTIVITGRRVREWGFWCPQGFVYWQQFTSADGNEVGRGCD